MDVRPDAPFLGPRSTLRRKPERGHHDRGAVHAILDEGLIAHLSFRAGTQPLVVPTLYARVGDLLYVHGSPAARWLRGRRPRPVCLAVTLVDGLVLARAAIHHSMNYRSVVVFGEARPVRDLEEKAAALQAIVEHVLPGRSADVREADGQELRYTAVSAIRIDEASAKVRTGGPIDSAEDMRLPGWAGVLPLALVAGAPIPDTVQPPICEAPAYVSGYVRTAPDRGSPEGPTEERCASAWSATPTTTSATSGGSSSS